ncbi:MAG: hypothetical protein NTY20_00465 [Candidatus Aenigmarchaeota archaeon]|nr:hypothetical protein [Candidatus Aenigmarchaeota archaeon]
MKIAFVFLALAILSLSGCTQQPAPQDYIILSTQDYNKSLCGGTGFNYKENGFNSGIKILAKDSQTGGNLTSNAYIITQASEGSVFPFSFSCEEQLSDPQSVISVYSNGHSPRIFEFNLPENQLVAIEVPLKKSCIGEKGCFDSNVLVFRKQAGGNQTQIDESVTNLQNWFYSTISGQFLLNQSSYTLNCMECNPGRGGFLKTQGTYGNTPFTLYYHTGWCSPGGGDCGLFACFSETSPNPTAAYSAIKEKLCSQLEYFNLTGYYNESDNTYSYIKTNDLTNQTRTECLQGGFEKIDAKSRTISIVQDSSMSGHFARKGETDCLAL